MSIPTNLNPYGIYKFKNNKIYVNSEYSIDDALNQNFADKDGNLIIEITVNDTFLISRELGDDKNKITNITLQSNNDNNNATIQNNIYAGNAETLNIINLTTTGSVFGSGTINVVGLKANRFSGSVLAGGGILNITGGTYTTRCVAGGTYNNNSTEDSSITINGTTDRTSFSGTICGGNIAEGQNISITQSGKASVTINCTNLVYIASNIYCAGIARSNANLTVSGDREVTITGSGSNLSFTHRISGAAQGTSTIVSGTANLNFADFIGKCNASISDFDTITISGNTMLELGRRQTSTTNTILIFKINSNSIENEISMYIVRDKNNWEFANTIKVIIDNQNLYKISSGTYVLISNYAVGFENFNLIVEDNNVVIDQTIVDNEKSYTLNYQSNKLILTYINNQDSEIINNSNNQQANGKEFIIYAVNVNGAILTGDVSNVRTISAKAGVTVVFNNSIYVNLLDQNSVGTLLYKDIDNISNNTYIEWIGNSNQANIIGELEADTFDISNKTLNINGNLNISNLIISESAIVNLQNSISSINTITISSNANLIIDVGLNALISTIDNNMTQITGSNGTITINNINMLTINIVDNGTISITNANNSLD